MPRRRMVRREGGGHAVPGDGVADDSRTRWPLEQKTHVISRNSNHSIKDFLPGFGYETTIESLVIDGLLICKVGQSFLPSQLMAGFC